MPTIQALAQNVIDQIAAGEVAERPAAIVKELLENSLDAGATEISVQVQLTPKIQITVSDNGRGMTAEDLALAPLRHTTSKLQTLEDLTKLQTYGFRGEALASMVAVSRLTLMSRTEQQTVGQVIMVDQGEVRPPRELGMARGTVIVVDNVFENLPVRKKFLKKPAQELQEVVNAIQSAAFAWPDVGFNFEYQRQRYLSLPAQQSALDRTAQLLHLNAAESLIPVEFGQPHLRVTGWITTPQLATYHKAKQFWLVNQRPVSDSQLSSIVKTSYGSLLEPRAEPIFVLNITVPPSQLDVNIHPHKETVAFSQENIVFTLVAEAIKEALQQHDLRYQQASKIDKSSKNSEVPQASSAPANPEVESAVAKSWQPGESLSDTQILQIDRTYLSYPTDQGLVLVDQHAAHERILFEEYVAKLGKASSPLKVPQLFALERTQKLVYQTLSAMLEKIGFVIEEFGKDSYKVTAVPTVLATTEGPQIVDLLKGLLQAAHQQGALTDWLENQRQLIATLACHSAVRAGDYLTPHQRQALIEKLQQTSNSATCPHGRPTTIIVGPKELAIWFKRRK